MNAKRPMEAIRVRWDEELKEMLGDAAIPVGPMRWSEEWQREADAMDAMFDTARALLRYESRIRKLLKPKKNADDAQIDTILVCLRLGFERLDEVHKRRKQLRRTRRRFWLRELEEESRSIDQELCQLKDYQQELCRSIARLQETE